MGNYTVIAAVTQALQALVQEAVRPVAGASVRTARPDRLLAHEQTAGTVNIFLYQVVPNAQWRNSDLPMRNAEGALVQRPRVALDLYYLFSFYGEDRDQVPQLLAGLTALVLYTQPALTSQPAETGEPITFYPVTLSLEELSKIWLIVQAPYALSMVYRGSVVVIDSDLTPPAPPPVRQTDLTMAPTRSWWPWKGSSP
jgi:hypothetical protein